MRKNNGGVGIVYRAVRDAIMGNSDNAAGARKSFTEFKLKNIRGRHILRLMSEEIGRTGREKYDRADNVQAQIDEEFMNRLESVEKKDWDKEEVTIRVGNSEVSLPKAEAVTAISALKAANFSKEEAERKSKTIAHVLSKAGFLTDSKKLRSDAPLTVKTQAEADAIIRQMPKEIIDEVNRLNEITTDLSEILSKAFNEHYSGSDQKANVFKARDFYIPLMRQMLFTGHADNTVDQEIKASGIHGMNPSNVFRTFSPESISALKNLTGDIKNPYVFGNAYDMLASHIRKGSKFIGYSPLEKWMRQAVEENNELGKALQARMNKPTYMAFKQALKGERESLGGIVDPRDNPTLRRVVSRLTTGRLAGPAALVQAASKWNYASYFAPLIGTSTTLRVLKNPTIKTTKEAKDFYDRTMKSEHAASLRNRGRSGGFEVGQQDRVNAGAGSNVYAKGRFFNRVREQVGRQLRWGDRQAIIRGSELTKIALDQKWQGQKGTKEYYDEAARMLTDATNETQVDPNGLNRAQWVKDKSLLKLPFTYMRGAKDAAFSAMYTSYLDYKLETDPSAKREKAKMMVLTLSTAGLMQNIQYNLVKKVALGAGFASIAALVGGGDVDDDDTEDTMKKAADFGGRLMSGVADSMIQVAPLGNIASGFARQSLRSLRNDPVYKQQERRLGVNHPAESAMWNLLDVMEEAGSIRAKKERLANESVSRREAIQIDKAIDKAFVRMVTGMVSGGGEFAGLPLWMLSEPVGRGLSKRIDGRSK